MIYYKELNLPPIPRELLDNQFVPIGSPVDLGYGATHIKNGKIVLPCNYWFKRVSDPALTNWITQTVKGTRKFDICMQMTQHDTGGAHIVHSDIYRKFALNYIVDTGGDNAWTSWYQEHGKPLIRSKTVPNRQTDTGQVDYENLNMLETVKFEKEKWYLIATDILHDVNEIVGTRTSISINVFTHNANALFDNLGITNE
jgi:hypothetical protein